MILLNPGPVTLSKRVRQALLNPDLCHREEEFQALQKNIRSILLDIYSLESARWAAVLLSGSGTVAMEAMITSLVPENGKLLALENGVYGERMSRIAAIHGIAYSRLTLPWGEPVDIAEVSQRLDTEPDITHVSVVHHETTTGRLNDLAKLGALCKERGVEILVDGVSSFGAEEINFDGWGVAACAATANKCLHGVPGVSFVIMRRDQLSNMQPRTLYLDLNAYCEAQDKDTTPFTPAIQSYYALAEALEEFTESGGWQSRHRQYRALCEQVRDGLLEIQIKPLLTGEQSVVLRAYNLPDGLTYSQLHDSLKSEGFVIYAGQGALSSEIFRISTMGAVTSEDMSRLLTAIQRLLDAAAV